MHPQPRLFHYSLDWRFLLPMADPEKICLLLEDDPDFNQALEQAGIRASQQLFFSEIQQKKFDEVPSLVMPFGTSVGWVTAKPEDQVQFYSRVRRLISSGGFLLVGFNNALNPRTNSRTEYYSSTPRRMAFQLRQAGFQSVKMFGAMPDLAIPEYVFELDARTIQFALQNRFRRKPALLRALRILARTIGLQPVSTFLPCYFALAAA